MTRSRRSARFIILIASSLIGMALVTGVGAAATVPATMPVIPAPQIPPRTFSVLQYGAVGDGRTLNTAALQKAIDACGRAGGGTVKIPAGRFLTGPLTLTSNLNLQVDKGATLLLSDNPSLYPVTKDRFQDCLSVKDGHDIAITGQGTIDGQGGIWWQRYVKSGPHRPFLVVLTGCRRVLVRDVTLANSPMFHLVPQKCRDVRIENIHITAPEAAKNTDGLDPSGWNFLITGCTFDVGDDCIALKPSGRIEEGQPACRDFLITNCVFRHGHGMSVGGQTPGGLENMTVRDCAFDATDAGIRLKASRGAGGLVENLTYENLTMKNVKVPILITSYYNGNSPTDKTLDPAQDPAQPVTATTPIWRHIRIRRVTAAGGKTAGQILGLAEMPISDVTLTDVNISARKGMEIIHARGVRFVNSRVTAQVGAPIIREDAEVSGLDRAANAPTPTFSVLQYGAVPDGKTKNTDAIARAVAACAAAGGGRVLFPAGTYLTGPIQLRSHIDLHLEPGATVLFSRDHGDYPLVVTRYEGLRAVRCQSPIGGDGLEDVSLTGAGVFDGQGETWRPAKKSKLPDAAWSALVESGGYVDDATGTWWPSQAARDGAVAVPKLQAAGSTRPEDYAPYKDFLRPTLVELSNCRHVTLDGPTFCNSPNWNLHLLLSDDVTVRNVTSFNVWWAQNGDGIDLDSCRRVLIADSMFNAGDDGICLKSGKNEEGRRLGRPTEDVTIRNCTVYRGHGGVVIGSEMSGGVRRVTAQNCVFDGTDIGLRFKSARGRGGVVEHIRASGLEMSDIVTTAILFDMYYTGGAPTDPATDGGGIASPPPVDASTPRFRDFHIQDVTCADAKSAVLIRGLPEMPIENITLDGVRIASEGGVSLVDAKDITLRNVRVEAQRRPSLQLERVRGLTLSRVQGLTQARS